jgi:hypothetical protein
MQSEDSRLDIDEMMDDRHDERRGRVVDLRSKLQMRCFLVGPAKRRSFDSTPKEFLQTLPTHCFGKDTQSAFTVSF